jgi:hypothetical protein
MIHANSPEVKGYDDSEPIGSVHIIATNFESAPQPRRAQSSEDLNSKIAELEKKNEQLQQINLQQSDAINGLQSSNESLINQNETLSQEIKSKDKLNEEFQKEIKALQTRVGKLTTDNELQKEIKALQARVGKLTTDNELLEKYRAVAMAIDLDLYDISAESLSALAKSLPSVYSALPSVYREVAVVQDLELPKQEAANHQSSSTGSVSRSDSAYSLSKASAPLITKSFFGMIGRNIIPSPAKATASILQPTTELSFSTRSRQNPDSPAKQNTSPAKSPEVTISSKDKLGEFQSSQFHARSSDGSDRVSKDLPDTPADVNYLESSKQDGHSSSRSLGRSKKADNPTNTITSSSKKDFDLMIQIRDPISKLSSIASAGIIFEMATNKELQITRVENGSNTKDEMTERLYGYFINQSSNFFGKQSIDKDEFIEHFSKQDINVKGEIEEDLKGFINHFKNKHLETSRSHAKSTRPTAARNLKYDDVNQHGSSR